MRYLLAVLTMTGREALLARSLASFERYVSPMPSSLYCHVDGDGSAPGVMYGAMPWMADVDPSPIGFCRSSTAAWEAAIAHVDCDWVVWLEDDFEFVRPVDLGIISSVLDSQPQVTQMAFYRNPYNDEEHRLGGYLNLPGWHFERRATSLWSGHTRALPDGECHEMDEAPWFEHRGFWTTNPSLFRRQIAVDFEWPGGPHCEGKMGFEIRGGRPGASFGLWGAGSFWVNHMDNRLPTGKGY